MTKNYPQPADAVDRAAQALKESPAPDGPTPELIASTLSILRTAMPVAEKSGLQEKGARMFRNVRIWSQIATMVAIATVLGWLTFNGNTSNVSFGDVLEKMKEAKSVHFIQEMKVRDQPGITCSWSIQGDHIRMEYPGQVVVVADLKSRRSVQLYPNSRTAERSKLPDDASKQSNNILYQLNNLQSDKGKRLVDEKLDGRTVLVYEFDDLSDVNFLGLESAEALMQIWVNPDSKLPEKIVLHVNSSGETDDLNSPFDTVVTFEKFEWNKKLDTPLFSMEIPKGYKISVK